ncbi:hypothetical protein [Flavobacterium sp.]|uniref:hypothetical protein n=1 Tax=Flavobacterium sp. TaxID=239 RepID=UPI00262D46F5|nr:hypothetical protein [Flavobacterium sp.]
MKNPDNLHIKNTSAPTEIIYNHTVYDMMVFCDGSWDQTYKKSLRFLDRNAGAKILYIEKPISFQPEENPAKFLMLNDNLHVLRPNVSSIDAVFKLLPRQARTKSVAVGWFCASEYTHFAELIRFKTVVCDCNAGVELKRRADIILEQSQKSGITSFNSRKNNSAYPVAS